MRRSTLTRISAATAAAALAVALPVSGAAALESESFAEVTDESQAVVSEQIGNDGSLEGDCTGTAIAPQWVVTARHCVDGQPKAGGSVRIGQGDEQRRVAVDRWETAPAGDVALLHTVEDMGLTHYPEVDDQIRDSGEVTTYGWSPAGSGSTTKLPTAKGKITGTNELAVNGAKQALSVELQNGARSQAGDSGGPLFYEGKVTGVFTAGLYLNEGDEELASHTNTSFATLADQRDWIMKTINGETTAADSQGGDSAGTSTGTKLAIGGAVGLVAVVAGGTVMALRKKKTVA